MPASDQNPAPGTLGAGDGGRQTSQATCCSRGQQSCEASAHTEAQVTFEPVTADFGGTRSFAAISARTQTFHRPVGPIAYDCVKVILVRDGSAILFSEFGQQLVTLGDAVLLCANTLCGSEPEGQITVTTVYMDTDYLIDQVFWQHVGLLCDRLDARDLAEMLYLEPAQVLHLGEQRAGMLMPWLDELVRLSVEGQYKRRFNRVQALWFALADVIAPFVKVSSVRLSSSQRSRTRPTAPRHRQFCPLREEARKVADLLRASPGLRPDRGHGVG